jgi:uncharacterized repeat protein (TIGR01451 family)
MKRISAFALGMIFFGAIPQSLFAACTNAPSGLVSWWPADGSANDIVGTSSGAMQGNAKFATGQVSGAFSFDGINSHVALPDKFFPFPTSGTANQPFTFEVWFRTTSGGVIFGQQAGSAYNLVSGYVPGLYVGTDGRLRAQMFWSGVTTAISSSSSVTNGAFHHAAVSYDGTNSVLYLDGVPVASAPWTQTAYASNYQYQFGTGYTVNSPAGNGGWFTFSGLIDEPSLYSRALNSNEVVAIYLAGSAGKCKGSLPSADLSLNLVTSTNILNLDQFLTYSLSVSNAGPNTATNLVINDHLPTNVSFVSASAPAGTNSYYSNTLTVAFTIPSLAVNSVITATILVQATAAGLATNEASVYSGTSDPVYPNNLVTNVVTINGVAIYGQYVEVGLSNAPNAYLQAYNNGGNYQPGGTQLSAQGVPFRLAWLNSIPGTTAVLQTPNNGQTNAYTFTLPPGIFATTLFTLINSAYGAASVNQGSVVVAGSRGETATLNLIEGSNIRDHNNGFYVNTFTDSTLVPTYFTNQVPNSIAGPVRLDRQELVLPSSFNGDAVTSITFNGVGNGDPNGSPFLAAMTLELVPSLRILLSTTNTVVVSWPSPSTDWTLQQNTNLNTANWNSSPRIVNDNGTNKFTIVNQPGGGQFYRLFKP